MAERHEVRLFSLVTQFALACEGGDLDPAYDTPYVAAMTLNVEKEIADLKLRVAEHEGSFSYITEQLREVQLFLHNNVEDRITSLESTVTHGFAEMRGDFGKINTQFDKTP